MSSWSEAETEVCDEHRLVEGSHVSVRVLIQVQNLLGAMGWQARLFPTSVASAIFASTS